MEETKVKTLSEMYCILKYFPKAYIEKIPPKILELISHFSDSKYYIDIDTEKALDEQKISVETKNMLIVFKYNYWSSEGEKQKIYDKLDENEMQYQQELREQYNYENIFTTKSAQENVVEKNVALIEYKEPIFRSIINKMKKVFKSIVKIVIADSNFKTHK